MATIVHPSAAAIFKLPSRSQSARRIKIAAVASLALLALSILPAVAQISSGIGSAGTGSAAGSSSESSGGMGGSTATGAAGVTSTGAPRVGNGSTMVARSDVKLIADLAHFNHAEIETGQLALKKSQNEQVKKYAQQMIDDHTKAQAELQTLADSKGVKLPDSPDVPHKALTTAMKTMEGTRFDSQYMKRAGLNDHQRTMQLLQKTQKNAKDADLQDLATKMMPTVQGHLTMAKQRSGATSK